jgi:hypothetical protein
MPNKLVAYFPRSSASEIMRMQAKLPLREVAEVVEIVIVSKHLKRNQPS